MSRRHVLGDLYSRCDAVASVPVYLENAEGEMLGYADQGLGHYADAFSFHIPEILQEALGRLFYFLFRRQLFGCTRRPESPPRQTELHITDRKAKLRKTHHKGGILQLMAAWFAANK